MNNKRIVFYISKYGVRLYKSKYNVDTENHFLLLACLKFHFINCLLFQSVNTETVHVL